MKKILLLSDTHNFLDQKIKIYAGQADEIWHAGDIGEISLIDELEFLADGSENPNFGGPLPDGEVNHDDCLECPLNEAFVGELGYVVNFCAPDDLLDGCYQLIVDDGDPQQVSI